MQIGDTIRVLRDEPSAAALKAGAHGTITSITNTGAVYARFPGGKTWCLEEEDFEVIEIGDAFAALTASMSLDHLDINALRDFYDEAAFEPLPGVPVEVTSDPVALDSAAPEPEDEEEPDEDDDDDEDCEEHPAEPHVHHDDGTVTILPNISITDYAGDVLVITDVREVTESLSTPVVLTIQSGRPGVGAMEIHLDAEQAEAVAEFFRENFSDS